MKIYYLDDEAHLCHIFSEYLKDEHTTIETYTQAEAFIDACNAQTPDLVFIDYRLAETSGDKVAKQIEATILKILVTGELDIPEHDLFAKVISKPYKLTQIKELVESYRK